MNEIDMEVEPPKSALQKTVSLAGIKLLAAEDVPVNLKVRRSMSFVKH